jgi:Flp pilus assembly protein TadG
MNAADSPTHPNPDPRPPWRGAPAGEPRCTPTGMAPERRQARQRLRSLTRALRSRRGIASLEFALLGGTVIVPIIVGTVDYGMVLDSYSSATKAQQAALMAALEGASDSSIHAAAQNAYSSGSPTVSVNTSWYCAPNASSWIHSGASYTSQPSCGTGYIATEYLTVTVTASDTLPVNLPWHSSIYQIHSSTMVRVQ